jgi:hypothetical protein
VRVTIPPAPREPTGWRAAAQRLLARLRPDRGTGIGAADAAEFDAAARQAFQAALKLDAQSKRDAPTPLVPASPPSHVAEAAGPAPEPAAALDELVLSTPNQSLEHLAAASGESAEQAVDAPRRGQPGDTAPDLLLRTPSSVTSVADDFFDSLIRHVKSDR